MSKRGVEYGRNAQILGIASIRKTDWVPRLFPTREHSGRESAEKERETRDKAEWRDVISLAPGARRHSITSLTPQDEERLSRISVSSRLSDILSLLWLSRLCTVSYHSYQRVTIGNLETFGRLITPPTLRISLYLFLLQSVIDFKWHTANRCEPCVGKHLFLANLQKVEAAFFIFSWDSSFLVATVTPLDKWPHCQLNTREVPQRDQKLHLIICIYNLVLDRLPSRHSLLLIRQLRCSFAKKWCQTGS